MKAEHVFKPLWAVLSLVLLVAVTPGWGQAPTYTEQARLASGTAGNHLGSSVSLSSDGNTVLIGADGGGNTPGAAYIFTRSGLSWSLQAKLTAQDGSNGDYFGRSVSLSSDGNTALIGAAGKTVGNNVHQGAAYVFIRSGSTWSPQSELTASDGAPQDYFGVVSLSADGNIALVGANDKTVAYHASQGAAYVFVRSGGSWSQRGELTASDGGYADSFGVAVSLSADGSAALVGAYNKKFGNGSGQGAAYIFKDTGGVWSQQAELTAADGAGNDFFGVSASLSSDGNTALIGAYWKTVGNNSSQGSAYLFTQSGGIWSQQQELTASDLVVGSQFGTSVSLTGDGKTALVGAPGEYFGFTGRASFGVAYIFTSGPTWSQQAELYAYGGGSLGASVSLNSNASTILLGAPTTESNGVPMGAGYVFSTNSASPVSRFVFSTPSAVAAGTPFGFSLSAFDQNNNPVIYYPGIVHFSSTDPSAQLPLDTPLVGGEASFQGVLQQTGSQIITATDISNSAITGSSAVIPVLSVNSGSSGSAELNGGNTFSGNQTIYGNATINGVLNASSFNCVGCIGNGQLGINYAAGDVQGGNALNALMFGGNLPSAFQPAGSYATTNKNLFAGDQNIAGNLIATGSLSGGSGSFTGTVSSGGSLLSPLGTATSSQPFNSSPLDLGASLFNSNSVAAQNQLFRWQAEPVTATNNTASPTATLNLLFGPGGSPSETGFSFNANGTVNFAPGQTFPGASSGTITSVMPGVGLSGGGSNGTVTLNNTGVLSVTGGMGVLSSGGQTPVMALDENVTDARYLQLSGGTLSGNLSAPSFSGNGTNLTGLNPANLISGTAPINITGSAATALSAASATTATNAAFAGTAAAISLTTKPAGCTGNNFALGINTDGSAVCAQPASSNLSDSSALVFNAQANTFTGGKQTLAASTANFASLNFPYAQPLAPNASATRVQGDLWLATDNAHLQFLDSGNNTQSLAFLSDVNSGNSSVNAEISAETAARAAGDTALTTNMNNETIRAEVAEGSLTVGLGNEVVRAEAAESLLTTNLNNEVTRATNAEGTKAANGVNADINALTALNQQNAIQINPFTGSAGSPQPSELHFVGLLQNNNVQNYVGFRAPASPQANKIWTLPPADGASGSALTTDGNGNLSWSSFVNAISVNHDGTLSGNGGSALLSVNGPAVVNLNASNLTTGTVPASVLNGTYNISISGNAGTASLAALATTATNASALGGVAPSGYAVVGANTYTGTQTMPSAFVTGKVTADSIAIGGGTPIAEYVSVTMSVTLPAMGAGGCETFTTAALTGFTPGTSDTIALGVPSSLINIPTAFVMWQAWETSTATSPTITIRACNLGKTGAAKGTIRVDVFKH